MRVTMSERYTLYLGDCLGVLRGMPSESVSMCLTSPPYWGLRDYGVEGQHGLEDSPEAYVAGMVAVFREVRRVLVDRGTLWLNIGDSYAAHNGGRNGYDDGRENRSARRAPGVPDSLKPKDLVGIPWMLAFALRADGWWLRQDIIWHKPNPMPESVTDRCTKAHEYVFLLSKSREYHYDAAAVAEQGVGRETYFGSDAYSTGSGRNDSGQYDPTACMTRNKRSVWTIPTEPSSIPHYAMMPTALARPCILAGCPAGGTVLDPFCGTATSGIVAAQLGCDFVGIELNEKTHAIALARLAAAYGQRRMW